ncbi:MAG: PIN domain nuclease [Candidatus Competibacteraceae bacterium]|nr:PIN domain nuclease [Candidatus Competibacteraceae bacterium]
MNSVLVDTSAWIGLLRNLNRPAVQTLKRLLDSDVLVALTPFILQEILQGAGSEAHFVTLQKYFADLPMFAPRNPVATHRAAAQLYCRCRWAGVTPRSAIDCLIASTAIEHALPLLHDDRDFEQIARIEPQLELFTDQRGL